MSDASAGSVTVLESAAPGYVSDCVCVMSEFARPFALLTLLGEFVTLIETAADVLLTPVVSVAFAVRL